MDMMIDDLLKMKKILVFPIQQSMISAAAKHIYKLSKILNISMEALLEPSLIKRGSFELSKSNVCHQLKETANYEARYHEPEESEKNSKEELDDFESSYQNVCF